MCLKDNKINYYHNMNSKEIENFAKEMKKYGYDKNNYIDSSKSKRINNTLSINKNNFPKTHYIAMETYRGLQLLNSTNEEVKLFDNDVYKKPISIFTDKYYIVADYNSNYTFKKFYVVNIINGNIKEIRSYDELSFDSIMEGAVDDDIYIYDKDKNAQYKISIEKETVEKETNIKYYNGKWSTITKTEALKGKKFDNYQSKDIKGYDKVHKIGDNTGYYYLYQKENNNYNVYRADVQNKKIKTYLFQTSDLNSIIYLNEYVYFIKGNSLYYYNGKGTYKVITNKELEFNEDISFGIYEK